MNITESAQKTDLPERFIRFLIKEKVFIPAIPSSTRGKSNDLTIGNIVELLIIKELKAVGVELAVIRKIIREADLGEFLSFVLQDKKNQKTPDYFYFLLAADIDSETPNVRAVPMRLKDCQDQPVKIMLTKKHKHMIMIDMMRFINRII